MGKACGEEKACGPTNPLGFLCVAVLTLEKFKRKKNKKLLFFTRIQIYGLSQDPNPQYCISLLGKSVRAVLQSQQSTNFRVLFIELIQVSVSASLGSWKCISRSTSVLLVHPQMLLKSCSLCVTPRHYDS